VPAEAETTAGGAWVRGPPFAASFGDAAHPAKDKTKIQIEHRAWTDTIAEPSLFSRFGRGLLNRFNLSRCQVAGKAARQPASESLLASIRYVRAS
jgi:hypothetical protein